MVLDVTQCKQAVCQRIGGTYCLQYQDIKSKTTWHGTSEDENIQCCEKVRSHIVILLKSLTAGF